MPTLTDTDRSKFAAEQLTEIDKLSSARLDEYATVAPESSGLTNAEYKRGVIAKWVPKSPERLRARVNLTSISWGANGPTITWAPEADYSAEEKASIEDILRSEGGKFEDVAVVVAAGRRSVEQRLLAGSL
jgi:hypothetical protein